MLKTKILNKIKKYFEQKNQVRMKNAFVILKSYYMRNENIFVINMHKKNCEISY